MKERKIDEVYLCILSRNILLKICPSSSKLIFCTKVSLQFICHRLILTCWQNRMAAICCAPASRPKSRHRMASIMQQSMKFWVFTTIVRTACMPSKQLSVQQDCRIISCFSASTEANYLPSTIQNYPCPANPASATSISKRTIGRQWLQISINFCSS